MGRFDSGLPGILTPFYSSSSGLTRGSTVLSENSEEVLNPSSCCDVGRSSDLASARPRMATSGSDCSRRLARGYEIELCGENAA